jgi:glyoxylase-like metal-dependent hydrolase (beta-lactamase superfamily II)/8-oxo-dGTP pyrophosphatase MutT (NUDIX family)
VSARPSSRLRDSAAVVLVRRRGDHLEAYWVKRGETVGYMPGFYAFAGGKVAAEDAELEVAGAADETERTFRACAIREALEETGVLVAHDGPANLEGLEEARRQLLDNETRFPDIARAHGWRFRADGLVFAGRWKTPPFASMRFDTIFYVAEVPNGQTPSIVPGELASGAWVSPEAALGAWRRGEATFAAPILWTMNALAQGSQNLAARLAEAPQRAAEPVRRIELKWGVVLHPMRTRPLPPATHTNAYLVGERDMALIDPGGSEPEDVDTLFKLIGELEADGRRLRMILATHHHPDHVGGIEAVRARHRVPVGAHEDTARHLRVDFTIADGQSLDLDSGEDGRAWRLEAIHTPGHTRGHLCFFEPRTRTLFSGDHIPGGRGTVIIDPPEGDMGDYIRSLERLLERPTDALFPGHGSPQGGVERRIRGLIAHRRERERKVRHALQAEPLTLRALVERAYQDTKPDLWDLAERSLLAHLLLLERDGVAERDGARWRAVVR